MPNTLFFAVLKSYKPGTMETKTFAPSSFVPVFILPRVKIFFHFRFLSEVFLSHTKVFIIFFSLSSPVAGSLVRSIMYPPPVDFKFEHDSYKFVALLAVTAFIGFIYTSITKVGWLRLLRKQSIDRYSSFFFSFSSSI